MIFGVIVNIIGRDSALLLSWFQVYRVGQKKVSLVIFAITLSTASQFS